MTVWITDATGHEQVGEVVSIDNGVVTMSSQGSVRRLRVSDIARVRVRQSDPVLNGALIGAGASIASGLFLCTRTEPWANCRDDVGPIVRFGALGAGIGAGVDALIRRRITVFDLAGGRMSLRAAPILGRHKRGVKVSVRW